MLSKKLLRWFEDEMCLLLSINVVNNNDELKEIIKLYENLNIRIWFKFIEECKRIEFVFFFFYWSGRIRLD